jgi:hypothetical protein
MTVWDLVRSLRRWWPVVLAGALLTALATYVVDQDRSVYYTRGEVTFLAPSSRLYPNSLSTTSEGLIITAGAIGKEISGPGKVTKFASPDVNLVGLGVRDGWAIRLPDTGGQWAPNFPEQQLIVEVVGPDQQSVEDRQLELITEIKQKLAEFQRDADVAPVNDITVKVTPDAAGIYHVGGSRVRALGVTAVLGGAITVLVVVLLETWTRRRRRLPDDAPTHDDHLARSR